MFISQLIMLQRYTSSKITPFCFTNYKGFDPEWASQNLQNGGPSSVTYQFGVNLKF